MSELLISDLKKIEILRGLSDGKSHSYYNLSKRLKTSFETVKKNCEFLELLGFIAVMRVRKEESASGKPYYSVKINNSGRDWLKSIAGKVK